MIVYDVVRSENNRSIACFKCSAFHELRRHGFDVVELALSARVEQNIRRWLAAAVVTPHTPQPKSKCSKNNGNTSFSARLSTSRRVSALMASSSSARRRRTAASLTCHDVAVAAPCPPLPPSFPGTVIAAFFLSGPPLLSLTLPRVAPANATDTEAEGCAVCDASTVAAAAAALACSRFTAYALLLLSPARAYLRDTARAWWTQRRRHQTVH